MRILQFALDPEIFALVPPYQAHEKENPKTTRAFPGKKYPGENGVFVSRASAPEAPAHVPARGLLLPCLGVAWALPRALPGLSRALLGACLGLPGLPGFAWVPWVPGKKGQKTKIVWARFPNTTHPPPKKSL